MGKNVKNYSACIGISIAALMIVLSLCSCTVNKSEPEAVHYDEKMADTDVKEKIYSMDELDRQPITIKGGMLRYPLEAMQENIEGKVVVGFILDTDGKVKDPYIVSSEPPKIFDDAAINSVVRSQYQPGYKDGKPVNVKVIWPVEFKLQN